MTRGLVLAVALTLSISAGASADEPPGRYQMLPITKPNAMTSTVLIIDTATGDLWEWFEWMGQGGTGGTGIRYEGAAVPGTKPGEIVARQGAGVPVIQLPRGNRQ